MAKRKYPKAIKIDLGRVTLDELARMYGYDLSTVTDETLQGTCRA
jgi:hypothetical protein